MQIINLVNSTEYHIQFFFLLAFEYPIRDNLATFKTFLLIEISLYPYLIYPHFHVVLGYCIIFFFWEKQHSITFLVHAIRLLF